MVVVSIQLNRCCFFSADIYYHTGNEARHIAIKNTTSANAAIAAAAVPDPVNYTYTNISTDDTVLSFVECDGPAIVIPDG